VAGKERVLPTSDGYGDASFAEGGETTSLCDSKILQNLREKLLHPLERVLI